MGVNMRFGYTILYVDDVLKTVLFYEEAFDLKKLFVHESNAYAEMDTGSTRLAFAAKSLARENGFDFGKPGAMELPAPFEIAFVTEDVETSFKKAVLGGAAELKKPTRKPWGQTVGYVRDCNGFLVEICSPMG
jgi:predicted enzyme related to lactoylglutathione lyase